RRRAMTQSTPPPPNQRLLEWLIGRRKETAYGLFALAAVLFGIAGWLAYEFGWGALPQAVGGSLIGLIALGAGLWQLLAPPGLVNPANTRLLVLAAGGLTGLVIALTAAARTWVWRDATLFGGLAAWQGEDTWWKVWVCIAGVLAGLMLMFVSLLLARTE